MIINMTGGGGGGASLNFDVKAYATEAELLAATLKENTIGIITTTPITSWIFSATEPTEPQEGMVWIYTGTSSGVEFNALKKNGIQVYPLSAKQYVGGVFVQKTAMSYQGGELVEWFTYLYNAGDECTYITGGWEILKSCDGTIIKNVDSVTFDIKGKQATKTYGVISTTDPVDLTNISTLRINADWLVSTVGTGTATRFGVSTTKPNSFDIVTSPAACISGGKSLDVSTLSDKHYVFVGAIFHGMPSYTAKIKLTEVMAE